MNAIIWKLGAGTLVAAAVATTAINQAPSTDNTADGPVPVQEVGAATPNDSDQTISSMAGILDREVEERLRLEEEVRDLGARLASLEKKIATSPPDPEAAQSTKSADQTPRRGGGRGEISESAFLSAGFDEEEAAYYRRLYDESIMAQLYLRDRARREGWQGNERYNSEMAALPGNLTNLRQQMDDDTYARYLYALGRPNQVTVQRVLAGSQAEAAGLQDGDVLLRVDGQRIYAPSEVRRASANDNASDTVAVEVLRGGRRIQAYIPRGPFGISMASDSILPGESKSGS